MIHLDKGICTNLEATRAREWLETNGIGGFSSSSIIGLNTRRYHGLLTAAITAPGGRFVLLSKLEETLFIEGQAFELSANQYPGVVHPHGFRYLKQFRLDPFPIFTYEIEGIEIEKSVFMVQGENSTVINYELRRNNHPESPKKMLLEIRPLIAFRDYHATTHENSALNSNIEVSPGTATVAPYTDLPPLHFAHNAVEVKKTGHWYRNFEYDIERERGLAFSEDLYNPLVFRFDLHLRRTGSIVASAERRNAAEVSEYRQREINRHRVVSSHSINDVFSQTLAQAADRFIVTRNGEHSVIAGYHWFGEWGRDTMIALPGLTLVTGRYEIARSILRQFARHVDQGMLPNRLPEAGDIPEYNTVDATLWFFEAIRSYLVYTDDLPFVRDQIYPILTDIISWHVRGTRYGIKVDPSGLLNSGEAGVQLTWMDAKVGDWVVTPRRGKPVEIQALWYNALRIMENLAQKIGDDTGRRRYRCMADLASWTFNRAFWNEGGKCLYDVVDDISSDQSVRPNQIFAVSLHHGMLSAERAKLVVEKAREHLLTPFGLRTLAPTDPHYRGKYAGGGHDRDAAYHQGTVWPWLLGAFITAYIRVTGGSDEGREQARQWINPLQQYLLTRGMGQIPEIFDGDPPHHPRGCLAQAWSVAEILRTYIEDIKRGY